MLVHGAERVVQEKQSGLTVEGPSKRDPCLLPARHGDAALTNLGRVAVAERSEVLTQRARADYLVVPLLVQRAAEQDVIPHSGVGDPADLRHIPHPMLAADAHTAGR